MTLTFEAVAGKHWADYVPEPFFQIGNRQGTWAMLNDIFILNNVENRLTFHLTIPDE